MRLQLEQAIQVLKEQNVLAIPTETVYGLAAALSSEEGIRSIFELKNRPTENPLIVHISNRDDADSLISALPPFFDELADQFWPGSLTLVVPASDAVPAVVRANLPTVGLRVPNHLLTRQLIEQVGPVVAPSANLSGRPSSTSPEHVEADFGQDFPVLDGGACEGGLESTIIVFQEGRWQLGRLGAVSCEELEEVLGYSLQQTENEKPLCPGQMFRHYSPQARLILGGERNGTDIVLGFEGREYFGAEKVFCLGDLKRPETVAHNLYKILRALDDDGVDDVWVDFDFPKVGILRVVAERLQKASR